MPLFEMGYRRYEGERTRRSPVLAMAWQGIRGRFRWWVWLVLIALLFYPYIVWAVLVYIALIINPGTPMGSVPTEAFSTFGPRPDLAVGYIRSGSPYLYWELMHSSTMANIVIPAMTCGGVLARDRASGAMQIYFARPVTRLHYLLSKVLTVATFSVLVTTLPTLLIWGECCLLGDPDYILKTWAMPFRILAASSLYAFWASAVVLALSATFKRPVLVGIAGVLAYLLPLAIGQITSRHLHEKAFRVIDTHYALGGATAPCFGIDLPEWLATPWLAVPSVLLPAVLMAYVWRRVRAVEVAT